MSVRMMSNVPQTKAAVTVAEMARMVGLSRSRFYQLMQSGAFPPPCFDLRTRRPIYMEEQQATCLEVRRRNCGINGVPVLFYARRIAPPPLTTTVRPITARRPASGSTPPHGALVESLRALGLPSVTPQQVESALRTCFPGGTTGTDEGRVIRSVFVHLRQSQRPNPGDSAGR